MEEYLVVDTTEKIIYAWYYTRCLATYAIKTQYPDCVVMRGVFERYANGDCSRYAVGRTIGEARANLEKGIFEYETL